MRGDKTKSLPTCPVVTGQHGLRAVSERPEDLDFEQAMEQAILAARSAQPDDQAHQAALDYVDGEPWEELRRAGMAPGEIVAVLMRKYQQAQHAVQGIGAVTKELFRRGR